jgi:peptidoglycan/LPS O-acetylase OafA/YrhL
LQVYLVIGGLQQHSHIKPQRLPSVDGLSQVGEIRLKVSFPSLWRLVKILALIQLVNAGMDYFMWVAYGFLVPSWTLATLSVGYLVLIFAVKRAQEKEVPPIP